MEGLVGSSGRDLGREAPCGRCLTQPSPSPQQTPVQYLLPEAKAQDSDKICVVIDLDETLVHSSFKVGPAWQPTVSKGGLPWPGREVSTAFPSRGLPSLQLQQFFSPHSQ